MTKGGGVQFHKENEQVIKGISNPVNVGNVSVEIDGGSGEDSDKLPRATRGFSDSEDGDGSEPELLNRVKQQPRRPLKKKKVKRALPIDEDELDFLANREKMRPQHTTSSPNGNKMGNNSAGPMKYVDQTRGMHMEDDNESYASSQSDINSYGNDSDSDSAGDSYEDQKKRKMMKLLELEDYMDIPGAQVRSDLTINNTEDDIDFELARVKKRVNSSQFVKKGERAIMMLSKLTVKANDRWDLFGLKLKGWDEQLYSELTTFHPALRRLSEKWGTSEPLPPELELVWLFGSSAFMFHLSNTLFKIALPNLQQMAQSNPELMQNLANAMANNMSANNGGSGGQPPLQQQQQQPGQFQQQPVPSTGPGAAGAPGPLLQNLLGGIMPPQQPPVSGMTIPQQTRFQSNNNNIHPTSAENDSSASESVLSLDDDRLSQVSSGSESLKSKDIRNVKNITVSSGKKGGRGRKPKTAGSLTLDLGD